MAKNRKQLDLNSNVKILKLGFNTCLISSWITGHGMRIRWRIEPISFCLKNIHRVINSCVSSSSRPRQLWISLALLPRSDHIIGSPSDSSTKKMNTSCIRRTRALIKNNFKPAHLKSSISANWAMRSQHCDHPEKSLI